MAFDLTYVLLGTASEVILIILILARRVLALCLLQPSLGRALHAVVSALEAAETQALASFREFNYKQVPHLMRTAGVRPKMFFRWDVPKSTAL